MILCIENLYRADIISSDITEKYIKIGREISHVILIKKAILSFNFAMQTSPIPLKLGTIAVDKELVIITGKAIRDATIPLFIPYKLVAEKLEKPECVSKFIIKKLSINVIIGITRDRSVFGSKILHISFIAVLNAIKPLLWIK